MKVSLSFEFNTNEEAEGFLRAVRERATVLKTDPVAPPSTLYAPPADEPAPRARDNPTLREEREMKGNPIFGFNTNEEAEGFVRAVRRSATRRKARRSGTRTTTPAPELKAPGLPTLHVAEDPILSADDVQKKVEAVFEARGFSGARDLLSRFGVARVRDLLPTSYGAVVALADDILSGKPA